MTSHLDRAIDQVAEAVRCLDRAAMFLDFAGQPRTATVVRGKADGAMLALSALCEIRGDQPRVINRDTSTGGTPQ